MPYKDHKALLANASRYREENREEIAAKLRAYDAAHKEERNAKARAYRAANRELIKARLRADYYANHEKRRASANRRTLEKRKTDPIAKLRDALRSRLYCAMKGGYRAGSAVCDLGCSIPDFKEYISGLFQKGMAWENWGLWHLDHKKPLSSFDLTDRAQLLEACHYSNYQPLWFVDNLRKGKKII